MVGFALLAFVEMAVMSTLIVPFFSVAVEIFLPPVVTLIIWIRRLRVFPTSRPQRNRRTGD